MVTMVVITRQFTPQQKRSLWVFMGFLGNIFGMPTISPPNNRGLSQIYPSKNTNLEPYKYPS